jgi:hypothetical protein
MTMSEWFRVSAAGVNRIESLPIDNEFENPLAGIRRCVPDFDIPPTLR